MSTIQLNGGVNNDPPKLQPPSGPTSHQMAAVEVSEVESSQEEEVEERYSLIHWPKGKSCFAQFTWLIIWPIHLLFYIAIPDCKRAKNSKIFPVTFMMCIVWIGSLSYVVAWMITIIGII